MPKLLLISYLLFPAYFTGHYPEAGPATRSEPVRIGMLISENTYPGAVRAAERAIGHANRNGGYEGRSFELVVRSTEGPWGAGSKESVHLVFEEGVLAILGVLDGRNAHLTEQVAAKSHLVYLEANATDPTLSQAFVPWFLRMVPSDIQQASVIAEAIRQRGGGTVAICTRDEYDSNHFEHSMTKALEKVFDKGAMNRGKLVKIRDPETGSEKDWMESLKAIGADHLVLSSGSVGMREILPLIEKEMPSLNVYGSLSFFIAWEESRIAGSLPMHMSGITFFRKGGNLEPGQAIKLGEAYVFDGTRVLLEAIRKAGTEKEAIREYLRNKLVYSGLTGPVSFDETGNRVGKVQLTSVSHPQQEKPSVR